MRRLKILSSTSGLSIIEVVVASALLGGLAAGLGALSNIGIRINRKIAGNLDKTSIIQKLQTSLDCSMTVAKLVPTPIANAVVCENALVDVYDHNNNLLISSSETSPTVIGDWTVRALCRYNPTNTQIRGIEVQVAQPLPGTPMPLYTADPTVFKTDPMTKTPYAWIQPTAVPGVYSSAAADVFPAGACPCLTELNAAFAGGGPPGACTGTSAVTNINFGTKTFTCSTPTPTQTFQISAQMVNTSSGCSGPQGSGTGKQYNAIAVCPVGYHVTGGGTNCLTGFGANLVYNGPYPYPLSSGLPTYAWSGRCCVDPGVPTSNMQVTAYCAPN